MTKVTPKSARDRMVREFKKLAHEVSGALDRKARFKARKLLNALGFRLADLKDPWFESPPELILALCGVHAQLAARLGVAGYKQPRETKAQRERRLHEEFLYRNNTYQGPAS